MPCDCAARARSPLPPRPAFVGRRWMLLSLSLSPRCLCAAGALSRARCCGRAPAAPAARPLLRLRVRCCGWAPAACACGRPSPWRGGGGQGGATRRGGYKTAAGRGWPPPTRGRQRPVLLAPRSRPPQKLEYLYYHPEGHSALCSSLRDARGLPRGTLPLKGRLLNRCTAAAPAFGRISGGNQRHLPVRPGYLRSWARGPVTWASRLPVSLPLSVSSRRTDVPVD
ncbi:hypothetical protein I4F81_011249 [Pyropia yezoensis]|uniref:Uncharacterized protein n=1 Tax=Pyropia yezoensis TaxID=2788 RepID=A0ACC3CFK0_PYRYE|nr:hypothetical protein I4F81_011249 [Neopyropia yezoensis]